MRGKGKEDQKKLFEKEKNNLQKNFEEERKEIMQMNRLINS